MLGNLHLALNHIPFVWIIFNIALLLFGMYRKNEELVVISLWTYVATAAITVAVFMSGWSANRLIMDYISVDSKTLVELHQDSAALPFCLMELIGGLAIGGIMFHRKYRRFPNNLIGGVIVLTLITFGLMLRTSHIGGLIRHIELRDEFHQKTIGFEDWNRNAMPPPLDAPKD